MLGMNDGTVSTASLMLGILAASDDPKVVLTAGVAGWIAGALSMAAGEYVSVSSQRDSELSDLEIEERSLAENPKEELKELAWIYEKRGLSPKLAKQVAQQLHDHSPIQAHARSELGISRENLAKPGQAATASALAFTAGALIPILAALVASHSSGIWVIPATSLIALSISGVAGAHIGGGNKIKAALRVFTGGAIAMIATFWIGYLIGGSI